MALSKDAKYRLEVAMADRRAAAEVAAAIDANTGPAAHIADISSSNLSAPAGTYAIPAEPTGAEVDATVQASVTEVEARLDAIEAKINAILAAFQASSQMS